MDILADLAGYEGHPGSNCSVQKLRAREPELAEQWDRALASSHQHVAIARWFAARGHPEITQGVVANHRAGKCQRCRTS